MTEDVLRDFAEDVLGGPASLTRQMRVGSCQLSRWVPKGRTDPYGVTLCDNDDEIYLVSEGEASGVAALERFLQEAQSGLSEENLGDAFEMCLSLHFQVLPIESLTGLQLYPAPAFRDITDSSGAQRRFFIAFCNDLVSGRVLRFTVREDYTLEVKDIGEGERVILE
ncbi:MAG: hypothetical protein AAFX06_31075 [Planctomycetota bacterium]